MHENGANSYSRFDRKATIVSSHFNICMRDQCCLDLAHWKSDILQTSTDNKSHTSRQARRRTRKETSRQRHNHTSVHICKYTIAWRADKTITTYRYPFSRRRLPFPTKTRARIDLSPGSRGKRVPRTEDREGKYHLFIVLACRFFAVAAGSAGRKMEKCPPQQATRCEGFFEDDIAPLH